MRIRFYKIGLIFAALLLIALTSYLMIRKDCCSEQLSEYQIGELERAAASGSVSAMKRLFFYYDEAEEPRKAAAWLKRAADAGDSEAEMLMFYSLNGTNDAGQKRLAMNYLYRAAEHGSSDAQTIVGEKYRDGAGVTRNIDTAKRWLEKAARAGDADAILALCDIAVSERDVEQCRRCLQLQNRALRSLHPKSYLASQLQEQRERISRILNEYKSP